MGDVFRTVNNGKDWQLVLNQDNKGIIALETDPFNPSHVYAAGSGGFVLFRSTDFGDSWRQISPDAGYSPGEITCMTVALMDTLPMSRLPRFGLFLGTKGTGVWMYDMLYGTTEVDAAPPLPERERLTVYPNPARAAVTVELHLNTLSNITLEVTDLLGRVVLRREFGTRTPGRYSFSLQTEHILPGSFLLRAVGFPSVLPIRLLVK
jgi:hypothetical protein